MKRKHASGVRFSQIPVMSRHASGNNGEVRGGQGSKGARAKRKRSCHARVKLFTRHILCGRRKRPKWIDSKAFRCGMLFYGLMGGGEMARHKERVVMSRDWICVHKMRNKA